MRYRIDPVGVRAGLRLAGADAATMSGNRRPLSACLESATSGCGGTGAVVAALTAFGAGEHNRIDQLAAQVESCVSGAAEAVAAYVQADRQMAADTAAADARSSTIASSWPWGGAPGPGVLK